MALGNAEEEGINFLFVCVWWWGWWYTHREGEMRHTAELGLGARIVFQVDKAEV